MPTQEAPATCARCGPVLARRPGTNHVLHLLITLFTCALWIPIWILSSINVGGWRCPACGGKAKVPVSMLAVLMAVTSFLFLIVMAIAIAVIVKSGGNQTPSTGNSPVVESRTDLQQEVRQWRANDGREISGRISAFDLEGDTVSIERADGEVFSNYPISNLHPEDAAVIRDAFKQGKP